MKRIRPRLRASRSPPRSSSCRDRRAGRHRDPVLALDDRRPQRPRQRRSPSASTTARSDYKVTPVYKGSYPESMAAAIAAYRAGNAPHILQVFEVGTATMMAGQGRDQAGVRGDGARPARSSIPKAYVPAVAGYYTNPKGQMLSFPFNSSTTVFWYNKDAFEKAGLDPNRPPKTWPEVVAAMAKLKASGHACPFTTGWQIVDAARELLARGTTCRSLTKENGFGGPDAKLVFNGPLQVRHIENMQDWIEEGLLHLRRPQERARGQVLQRRVRDADDLVGGLRARSSRTPSSSSASRDAAVLRRRRRARRRTRSSAARSCG